MRAQGETSTAMISACTSTETTAPPGRRRVRLASPAESE
jgi:hypothetical protein